MKVDVLIAGQGLAGTALALALRERGKRVFVVDRDEENTSSKIAAGLITPVTGKNLSLSWRMTELWPVAKEFWRKAERNFEARFLHEVPITRLFKDNKDVTKWETKKDLPGVADFVSGENGSGMQTLADRTNAEFGGFTMKHSGWADTRELLSAARKRFEADGVFAVGSVDANVATPFRWNEVEAERAVFCQGFDAARNPLFDWVPWRAAKGEILDLRFREPFPEDRILNRGSWLLPAGEGQFRTGATYAWHELDKLPTGDARETLEKRLRNLTSTPYDVEGHTAAVRPIIRESRLLMGWHPAEPKIGFFNGLGSKGVLTAPFFARQFAAALDGDGTIDPEVDLRKNL